MHETSYPKQTKKLSDDTQNLLLSAWAKIFGLANVVGLKLMTTRRQTFIRSPSGPTHSRYKILASDKKLSIIF